MFSKQVEDSSSSDPGISNRSPSWSLAIDPEPVKIEVQNIASAGQVPTPRVDDVTYLSENRQLQLEIA